MQHITIKNVGRENQIFRNRVIFAIGIITVLFLVIIGRLFLLQVVKHDHFTTLSRENRVKVVPIAPTRGLIYSRDGHVLAENRPSFNLEVVPERVADIDAGLEKLSAIVALSDDEISRFKKSLKRKRRFENVTLKYNLTEEEVARFAVNRHWFTGIDIAAQANRYYPFAGDTAHVIGYVARINERELQNLDATNYSATSHMGKSGIEKSYEELLHGTVGYQQVEINAQGRVLRVLERTPPVPGNNLHLSLDIGLQEAAIAALGENRGSVVAIEPNTGEVLALVSTPGFDPNLFVNGISTKMYSALRDSPARPLFNRALQGQYPPGSTVKPFLGMVALDRGFRAPEDSTWCPGFYQLGGREHKYRCWKKHGHGHMDLEEAIMQSCDVYFYALAQDMGIDEMYTSLSAFSFGKRTGVDLPGERAGLMPSRQWKRKARSLPWYPGETLITGIGQGFYLSTPIQLASATATLSMKGRFFQPHLLTYSVDGSNHVRDTPAPKQGKLVFNGKPENWQRINNAMVNVVHSAKGTAHKVGKGATYQFAGKTGTAQVFTIKQDEDPKKRKDVGEYLRDHALFVAYAPAEKPSIAIAILVENGGSGSSAAAPIARRLFDYYMVDRLQEKGDQGT